MRTAQDDGSVLRFGMVAVHLGEKSGKYPDGNQVLVQGGEMRVAFDTPLVANRIGADFDAVDLVILGHVHEDHLCGLHRVPAVPVHVHPADLAAARSWDGLARHFGYRDAVLADMRGRIETEFHYQPRPGSVAYPEGWQWDLGGGVTVHAEHLPGHTAGHCALVVDREGLAFIGDIDLSGFGPYYGDATSNLADFRRTLAAVARLDARIWVTSHHRGVITDRAFFLASLAAFAAKIDARRERLLAYLADGPLSMDALVRLRLIYPPEHDMPALDCIERRSIAMHLDELIDDGGVRPLDDGRFLAV